MRAEIYTVTNTANGGQATSLVGYHNLLSFVERTKTFSINGGDLQASQAQLTTLIAISDTAILKINDRWFRVLTHNRGMINIYLYHLEETTAP